MKKLNCYSRKYENNLFFSLSIHRLNERIFNPYNISSGANLEILKIPQKIQTRVHYFLQLLFLFVFFHKLSNPISVHPTGANFLSKILYDQRIVLAHKFQRNYFRSGTQYRPERLLRVDQVNTKNPFFRRFFHKGFFCETSTTATTKKAQAD